MDKNLALGSRIPRAPKRALKTLSANEVNAKGAAQEATQQQLKKPRLADVPKAAAPAATPTANAGPLDTEWLEISEKNDLSIDSLLGMRMTGKGKWDHKGRCEQMMPYIKQLRACTKYLRSYVAQADSAKQSLVDAHEKSLSQREAELAKLTEQVASLDKECASSKDTVAEMTTKVSGLKEELDAKHEVEMQHKVELSQLTNELAHEKKVAGEKAEEVTKLQDNYVKSQEYAQNLQDFVKKLKEDTQKMNDSLLKIQDEKADLVTQVNNHKGAAAQLEVSPEQHALFYSFFPTPSLSLFHLHFR